MMFDLTFNREPRCRKQVRILCDINHPSGKLYHSPPTRYGIVTMSGISARNWYRRELSRLHKQVRIASHGLQCSMLRCIFKRGYIYSKSFAFAFRIAQHLPKLFCGANCDWRLSRHDTLKFQRFTING